MARRPAVDGKLGKRNQESPELKVLSRCALLQRRAADRERERVEGP